MANIGAISISIGIIAASIGIIIGLKYTGVLDVLLQFFQSVLSTTLDLFNKAPRIVQIMLFTLVVVFLANFIMSFLLGLFWVCNDANVLYQYGDPLTGMGANFLLSLNATQIESESFIQSFGLNQVPQAQGFKQVLGVGCKEKDPRLLIVGIDIFNPIIWMMLLLISLVIWIKIKL